MSFGKCNHLFNPYNDNRPVKIGRDGQVRPQLQQFSLNLKVNRDLLLFFRPQEIEPHVGEALCRLFLPDDSVDLRAIAVKAKRAIKRYIERERFGKHREAAPVPTRLGLSASVVRGLVSVPCAGLVVT